MKILLVDDHAFVREGLKAMLALMPAVSVVGEAANGSDALAFLARNIVDVVILDLSLPGRSGLDVLRRIKRDYPPVAVVVLSMHAEDSFGPRAIRAGASAYVAKDAGADHLEAALTATQQRDISARPSIGRTQVASEPGVQVPTHVLLSEREYEILLLIGQGFAAEQIASRLGIRQKTVGGFRRRILEKLGLTSTAQLMHYAITQGLVDFPLVVR